MVRQQTAFNQKCFHAADADNEDANLDMQSQNERDAQRNPQDSLFSAEVGKLEIDSMLDAQ